MEGISVAIRVKPTTRQEAGNGTQWKVVGNTISLHNEFGASIKGQTYKFDTIFGTSIRNSEIYEHTKDLVLSAVSGFNGTVFAYGQTSSGKTYTMQGSASDPGLIRLAIQDVFINIDKIEDREFLVRVSYMEIYNEEINDLLAPENRKLQIFESIERGIFVAGMREEIADSVEQVIAALERGEAKRQFAETDMNLNSSRSHTIFRMVIESRDKSHDYKQDSDPSAQDAVRVSTLYALDSKISVNRCQTLQNLVDLAGSERISKSGVEGARSKEGAHINKSLTTLGIVINKLSEGGGKQGSHIPYRDSKLTRMLQSALGGNARTAIICTINPDEIHIDETRSTLQFASRAKRITNCAQVNEMLTDAALLKRQKEEIKELRRRLEGSPHTEDLKKEILHLRNDLLKYELGRERLGLELQQEIKAQVERERRIKEQELRIENLSSLVISGAGANEDRELPQKMGYRSETWCPQSTTSNSIEQGLGRIDIGNDHFSVSASVEANPQPLATPRGRTFGPSPAFESLVDDEINSFWSNSSGANSLPALGDYQNVANGDIWTSLKRGTEEFVDDASDDTWDRTNVRHVNVDSRSSCALSDIENTRESKKAQPPLLVKGSSEISMLQQQLIDMNFQYQELQPSMEFKIQEKTKEAIATANNALREEKSRFQLQVSRKEITKLLGKVKDMEVELKNCHEENDRLRAKTVLHDQLLHTRAALEQGVHAERVSMDEEKEIFKRSLCSLEMRIQDDHYQRFDGAPCLKDVFAHDELVGNKISDMCTSCQSATNECIQRSSLQYGVLNSDCTLRSSLKDSPGTQISEILVHDVSKKRLFDDKSRLILQMRHEENSENWNESRSRLSPGNAAHSDDKFAAFSRSCCRFEQFADPAVKEKESSRKESTVSLEAKDLKSSLHLANRLGSELLQELHSILNHDIRCLEGHAATKGTVGKSLEALQVLLLESAHVGLHLFSILSSKESSLAPTRLQQLIQEVANHGASTFLKDCGATEKMLLQRSEIDSDYTKLVLKESAVYCIHSTHDTPIRQGMDGWSIDSMAVRDSVGQSNTWYQSLDGASLLSSQDPGEDICNIDLHQACDEEPGMVLNSHSVTLDVQMTDKQRSQEYLQKVQVGENFAEELKIMGNMSEAEKQFTKELLNKVKALEARLTVAEMEIVEYKVELEHLKMNNLRTSLEASLHSDDWELQNLRVECEIQKEEIRQLMEQVMTPDEELERESLLRETMEQNNYLENCLKKAERRLIGAEGWCEELPQLTDAEIRREKSYHDIQARNAVLEREGVLLSQEMSKFRQSAVPKDNDSREHLYEVSKSDILNEAVSLKFQLLTWGEQRTEPVSTASQNLDPVPARVQDETEHLSCRPLRRALGESQHNLLQPCILNDLGGYTCGDPDIRKLHVSSPSEKENQLCPQLLFTAAH